MDGKFVLQIGKPIDKADSNSTERLGSPADIAVDVAAKEVYVADGYTNRRVVVFDSETGAYKRHWGAYGNRPSDDKTPPYDPGKPVSQQFGNPVHCVRISKDGLVYVCDRINDRYQIFRKDGTFVSEHFFERNTRLNGSVYEIAFSPDKEQKFIYMVDWIERRGAHRRARQPTRRSAASAGSGRQAGEFVAAHNITRSISKATSTPPLEVATGERVQRFRWIDSQIAELKTAWSSAAAHGGFPATRGARRLAGGVKARSSRWRVLRRPFGRRRTQHSARRTFPAARLCGAQSGPEGIGRCRAREAGAPARRPVQHQPAQPGNGTLRGPDCRLSARCKSTAIPPKLKQIAIMLTARFWGGQYVWYSHRQQALDAGLSAAFIDAMAAGERPADMTADEAVVYDFCAELLATRQVDDAHFKALAERFGERGVVELVGLMGQYHTISMLFAVDRYPLPDGARQDIDKPK